MSNCVSLKRLRAVGWGGDEIFRKIIKIVATRCQIVRLKCIQIDFRPRPHWVSLQRSLIPIAGIKRATSKGMGEMQRGKGEKGRQEIQRGEGKRSEEMRGESKGLDGTGCVTLNLP